MAGRCTVDQSLGSQKPFAVNPPATDKLVSPDRGKLGLILLSGLVVGSMIGGGSFNLPQNMASGASLGAVTIAWIVTLGGMVFLFNAFRTLADTRPDIKAGVYRYRGEGIVRRV